MLWIWFTRYTTKVYFALVFSALQTKDALWASSESVAGAGVLLFRADQREWGTHSLWEIARADAEGRFSLRLAPGEYVAVAWSLKDEPTVPLDAYVRARMSTAQRVTLQPNETRTVEVQVSCALICRMPTSTKSLSKALLSWLRYTCLDPD